MWGSAQPVPLPSPYPHPAHITQVCLVPHGVFQDLKSREKDAGVTTAQAEKLRSAVQTHLHGNRTFKGTLRSLLSSAVLFSLKFKQRTLHGNPLIACLPVLKLQLDKLLSPSSNVSAIAQAKTFVCYPRIVTEHSEAIISVCNNMSKARVLSSGRRCIDPPITTLNFPPGSVVQPWNMLRGVGLTLWWPSRSSLWKTWQNFQQRTALLERGSRWTAAQNVSAPFS